MQFLFKKITDTQIFCRENNLLLLLYIIYYDDYDEECRTLFHMLLKATRAMSKVMVKFRLYHSLDENETIEENSNSSN